jgi:DNA (cytosine-5)-methyltransferase 1
MQSTAHVKPANFNHFHIPNMVTKELGIISKRGEAGAIESRKIRLSSNWLLPMGFEPGKTHSVEVLPGMGGMILKTAPTGQKVYSREYKSRRNNPLEAVIEIGAQNTIREAIPAYTERLHFTMRPGEVLIRPLPNHTFAIRKSLREAANPFEAFVAMTAGVDVRCMMDCGFSIDSVLEFRPSEKRDTKDLTETGALNIVANATPRNVFNEDISRIDWDTFRMQMRDSPQISVLHISLQCDDFTNVKAKSLKERSLEDMSSSKHLVYDALRLVETLRPACVVLEQVPGFGRAAEGELFLMKLKLWGYNVNEKIMRGNEYGGLTGRERYYVVASVFPNEFEWPESSSFPNPLWGEVSPHLENCRDVTHTKSLHDGLACGRARLLSKDSKYSPTILKSQFRQAKDSLFIDMQDGTYRFPSLELLQHLQGIPADFSTSSVTTEVAAEIIGQSVDYRMHHALMMSVKSHIAANVGDGFMTVIKNH